jgi:hypothetical protein
MKSLNQGFLSNGIPRLSNFGVQDSQWGQNLVLNGGFEIPGAGGADVFQSWSETAGSGTVVSDTLLVYKGNKSCKFTSGGSANTVTTSNIITVIPGETYDIYVYSAGDGLHSGRVQLFDNTNSTGIRPYLDTEVLDSSYQKYEFIYNAPPSCNQFRLDLRCSTITGAIVWFDEAWIAKRNQRADYITRPAKTFDTQTWTEIQALGTKTLLAMSNSGVFIAKTAAGLYKSVDKGANWVQISYNPGTVDDFPENINAALVTDSGHIIVASSTNQKIYRSNSTAWDTGFSVVLTLEGAGTRVETNFGMSSYGTMVFLGEYNNTDLTPRIYRSMDSGATWAKVFTGSSNHWHHVVYDPYDDVVWAICGDGTTNRNIFFSLDKGDTWKKFRPPGKCPTQLTQIIPLPECVLFLTDASPAGAWSLKRRTGLRGWYEELLMVYNLGTFSPVPVGSQPAVLIGEANGCAYFSFMYSDAGQSAIRPLIATRDGSVFTTIVTPTDAPSGSGDGLFGIRNIFRYGGYLYGLYSKGAAGNYLFEIVEPTQS